MDHLNVDTDQAHNTSRAVGNDAQELRDELAGLQRDWAFMYGLRIRRELVGRAAKHTAP